MSSSVTSEVFPDQNRKDDVSKEQRSGKLLQNGHDEIPVDTTGILLSNDTVMSGGEPKLFENSTRNNNMHIQNLLPNQTLQFYHFIMLFFADVSYQLKRT